MPALVTGATGLLGSHVADLLVARGERVRALVLPGERAGRLEAAGVEVCRGDLAERASLQAAVMGMDRVFHCAARTGIWGPRPEYEAVNVRGLQDLLEAALAAGVRRFVHVSSHTVHGNNVRGAADETAPLRVDPNPYSWSKVMGEQLLLEAIRERQAPITIVRPGLLYGPRDQSSFGRFVRMIEHGRMVVIGSGANHIPLVYVTDAAEGILLAGECEEAVGRAYLLVSDELVTQGAYLGAIANALRVPPPKVHIPFGLALAMGAAFEAVGRVARLQQAPPLTRYGLQVLGGENRFVIDRARRELGFSPRTRLIEGVRQGINWYRTGRSSGFKEG